MAGEITALLGAWRAGDDAAREELLRRVYGELKRIAGAQLRGERAGHTLEATALVHEAFLRLVGQTRVDWRDRSHFFGLAAVSMRRVLVDHARARQAAKRKHEEIALPISLAGSLAAASDTPAVELLDLDRALDRLAARFPRPARVVELRYFGGLELEEVATCLELSPRTVKRDWAFARAFLARELAAGPPAATER